LQQRPVRFARQNNDQMRIMTEDEDDEYETHDYLPTRLRPQQDYQLHHSNTFDETRI